MQKRPMEKVTMGTNQKVKPTQKWYRVVAEVATLLRWFSVTRFDYNGAEKSHDLLKMQGLLLVEILFVKKILYKICFPV